LPSNDSATWRLLPSTGSRRVQFAGFHGTMRHSDSLPPSRRASLCFAWRYHALRRFFRSRRPRTLDRGPGVGVPVSPAGISAWRGPGRPKFLGDPRVPMPCSPTPVGPNAPRPSGAPMRPPWCPRRRLRRV